MLGQVKGPTRNGQDSNATLGPPQGPLFWGHLKVLTTTQLFEAVLLSHCTCLSPGSMTKGYVCEGGCIQLPGPLSLMRSKDREAFWKRTGIEPYLPPF